MGILDPGGVQRGAIVFNVNDYGALGNDSANDTAAVQAAIDAASASMGTLTGYGTSFMAMAKVHFPPGVYKCSGLILPGRIHFTGSGARLKANAAGPILTLRGESNVVSHLMFDGNGVAMASSGIVCDADGAGYTRALRYHIHDVRFQDFAGRALWAKSGSIGYTDHLFAQNILLDDASLTTYAGAVQIEGNDSTLSYSEISASRATMSAGGFVCALVITGVNSGNHSIGPGVVLETSDHGAYINPATVAGLKFTDTRADLNRGHGFIVAGGVGVFQGCHSYRNGQQTANTYNGYQVTGGQYVFDGCLAEGLGSLHLYGFNDTQNSDTSKNWYTNCRSLSHSLKGFNNANTGARITLPHSPMTQNIGTGTTWNVDQLSDIKAPNAAAVTVTGFTNGYAGQRLRIYGDGFTTITHAPAGSQSIGAAIINKGGANLLLAANTVYDYVRQVGIWYQV